MKEPPLSGLFCDLIWADPIEDELANTYEFLDNEERECSFVFG